MERLAACMRKILIISFMLLLLVMLSVGSNAINLKTLDRGQDVVLLQRRLQELDYFHFKPTGVFGNMTRTAVMRFQESNDVTASGSGVVDDVVFAQLFSKQAKRNPVPDNVKIPIGPALKGSPEKSGEKAPWSTVKPLLKTGVDITITDYNTDKTFAVRYFGGENHAEVECAAKEDYKTYLSVFGDAPNWSKRPVLVSISGKLYAASMQGLPFGTDKISDNDMSGTCCLYFFESTSDILGIPDAEHNANVIRAATLE